MAGTATSFEIYRRKFTGYSILILLFQFLLIKFSKSKLFSCIQKVDQMTNYCKRPLDKFTEHTLKIALSLRSRCCIESFGNSLADCSSSFQSRSYAQKNINKFTRTVLNYPGRSSVHSLIITERRLCDWI